MHTVSDLITLVGGILPYINDYTLMHNVVDVQHPNFQYLLEIIDLPFAKGTDSGSRLSPPPSLDTRSHNAVSLLMESCECQINLILLVVSLCIRIGITSTINLILPSVEIFFKKFVKSYSELPLDSPETKVAVYVARSLYLPLIDLVGARDMKERVPSVSSKLYEIICAWESDNFGRSVDSEDGKDEKFDFVGSPIITSMTQVKDSIDKRVEDEDDSHGVSGEDSDGGSIEYNSDTYSPSKLPVVPLEPINYRKQSALEFLDDNDEVSSLTHSPHVILG